MKTDIILHWPAVRGIVVLVEKRKYDLTVILNKEDDSSVKEILGNFADTFEQKDFSKLKNGNFMSVYSILADASGAGKLRAALNMNDAVSRLMLIKSDKRDAETERRREKEWFAREGKDESLTNEALQRKIKEISGE
mgnify:CR=1 FL=1